MGGTRNYCRESRRAMWQWVDCRLIQKYFACILLHLHEASNASLVRARKKKQHEPREHDRPVITLLPGHMPPTTADASRRARESDNYPG